MPGQLQYLNQVDKLFQRRLHPQSWCRGGVHSVMNKVTGGMLFVLPLTLAFIGLRYSVAVVCIVATVAAIQEGLIARNQLHDA